MCSVLFAYGTLQHPAIIRHILGRIPDASPAVLRDYARYTIRGENYPGLVPEKNARTAGTLFFGILLEEWARLDSYESDLYVRQTVLTLRQGQDPLPAQAYILPPRHFNVLSEIPWDLNTYNPNPLP